MVKMAVSTKLWFFCPRMRKKESSMEGMIRKRKTASSYDFSLYLSEFSLICMALDPVRRLTGAD
jgi:hypothetical protein